MRYDIAAKAVIEAGKELILRRFLGIEPGEVQLLEEVSEETVSLRRSDFPMRVALRDGREVIVLLEIQTSFSREFVLRFIDYTVRFMLRYHLEVIPLVMVLRPSMMATGYYEGKRLRFNYEVVRIWEEQAEEFRGDILLYPFLPLMEGGLELLEEAEERIYRDIELSIEEKGDLLTAMAIFTGMRDKDLAIKLIERRRDIVIQSPVYEIIKEEGIKEGVKEGIKEGIKEGLLEDAREMVLEALNERFGEVPSDIPVVIRRVEDRNVLKLLHRLAIRCSSLEEFKKKLNEQR